MNTVLTLQTKPLKFLIYIRVARF